MNIKEKYKGVIVPMVSPFTDDYKIDIGAVNRIIDLFIDNNSKPFVLGTTGEAQSLSTKQKIGLIKATAKALRNMQPLLAGIGNNSIFTSVEEGKMYADLGVDALVTTIPNYYPSDGNQMLKWCEKLADRVPLPLFIYNIPVTVHHSIPLEVIETLSYHPNIIGIKDSENNKERLIESLKRWKHRDDFIFLVGWAAMSTFGLKNGANGIVPSMGNLIPHLYRLLVEEVEKGNYTEAENAQDLTNEISSWCQKERNVSQSIPAMKVLMSIKGLCGPQVMPPMLKMDKKDEIDYIRQMRGKLEKMV